VPVDRDAQLESLKQPPFESTLAVGGSAALEEAGRLGRPARIAFGRLPLVECRTISVVTTRGAE